MLPMEIYDTPKEYLNASTADLRSLALESVERAREIAHSLGGEALSRAQDVLAAAEELQRASRALSDYLQENGMADPE